MFESGLRTDAGRAGHGVIDPLTSRAVDPKATRWKTELFGILERVCDRIEPSPAQVERAKTSYEAVGKWLANSGHQSLATSHIYLQGSAALGTTVRPIGMTEHDVDLVCRIPSLDRGTPPAVCKRLIGDRLRENEWYSKILEEKARCWRLNFANEFHLDITPSVPNGACRNGGELVPDRELRCWKETNPRGYRDAFNRRAELIPRMRLAKRLAEDSMRADANIEPYPRPARFRSLLCRIVQVAKRHRDIYFLRRDASLAPISIIITTLAAWSYESSVETSTFDSELDVLYAVARQMPDFIDRRAAAGRIEFVIPNETTVGENFAERWNADPRCSDAFFEWHGALASDLERLARRNGLDVLSKNLSESFGHEPAAEVLRGLLGDMRVARRAGSLSVAPQIGLTAAGAAESIPVRRNTFYGAR